MTAISRFRTQGSQSPSQFSYNFYGVGPSFPGSPRTYGTANPGSQVGTYKSIADENHRGFRKSGDPSKWVAGPLDIVSLLVTQSTGSATTQNTPDSSGNYLVRTWSGDGLGFICGALCPTPKTVSFGSYPDLVNVAALKSNAVVGCLNQINPAQAQSLVTIAEGRKSVDMILDRARKLALTWKHCLKGDVSALENLFPGKRTKHYPKRIVLWDEQGRPIIRKNGKVERRYGHIPMPDAKSLDRADRLWLEFRYGWSPAVLDIVDSLKAINAQSLRNDLAKKDFISVHTVKSASNQVVTPFSVNAFGGGNWTGTTALTHEVRVKAYAKYQVAHESGIMNRMNDFGVFDIPKYIWEVCPYSFVVDWFVPVGDWLGAITPKVGVNVISSGMTTTIKKTVRRTLSGYTAVAIGPGQWPSPPFPLGSSDGFEAVVKSRSIGLSVPFFPSPEVNLNFKRLVDAVTLLTSLRR